MEEANGRKRDMIQGAEDTGSDVPAGTVQASMVPGWEPGESHILAPAPSLFLQLMPSEITSLVF